MKPFRYLAIGLIWLVGMVEGPRAEAGGQLSPGLSNAARTPSGSFYGGCHHGCRYPYYPYYGSYFPYYGTGLGYAFGDPFGYPPFDPYANNPNMVPPPADAGAYPQPQRYNNRMTMPPPGERAPMPRGDTAEVIVNVPEDAEVWIEGAKMKQTGVRRRFTSPALVPGQSYAYEIRASWSENGKQVSDTKNITIHAGDRSSLTFIAKPERAENTVSKAEK